MIPAKFDYFRPATLDEAIALLAEHGEEAKVLSGGQSLIPLLKIRLAAPGFIVDINRIPGLDVLAEENGFLRIGALVRESDLESSSLVRDRYPLLHDAAAVVADPLVRNRATVCGNIAHGDPANDHPAAMLALGARVVARGPSGERVIPIEDFFTGLFGTALEAGEIVTELRIPVPPPRSGGAYVKLERKVGDFATAAVAVQVTLDASGVCTAAGVGLTNAGFKPMEATAAEAALVGQKLDDTAIAAAAKAAADTAEPVADRRGSVEYKKDLVKVLTTRALRTAGERANRG